MEAFICGYLTSFVSNSGVHYKVKESTKKSGFFNRVTILRMKNAGQYSTVMRDNSKELISYMKLELEAGAWHWALKYYFFTTLVKMILVMTIISYH